MTMSAVPSAADDPVSIMLTGPGDLVMAQTTLRDAMQAMRRANVFLSAGGVRTMAVRCSLQEGHWLVLGAKPFDTSRHATDRDALRAATSIIEVGVAALEAGKL